MKSQHQIVPFSLRNEEKLSRQIQKNAGRRTADTIPSLSSQSERAKNTIHWTGLAKGISNFRIVMQAPPLDYTGDLNSRFESVLNLPSKSPA